MIGSTSTALSPPDFDERFGLPRYPSSIRDWEADAVPKSLVRMTKEIGADLKGYRDLAQTDLFWNVSQCFAFIWAMDSVGDVHIAYEEILVDMDGVADLSKLKEGYPRRRGFPVHPAMEKKLGHPTLIGGGPARVAGELFLDVRDQKLHWFVNCGSGRYCADRKPSKRQSDNVHELFMEFIDNEVLYDDFLR